MILSKTFIASAGLMLLVGTSPAYAQHRGGDGHGHGGGGDRGRNEGVHAGAPRSFNAPRASIAPRVYGPSRSVGIAPRSYARVAPRSYAGPHANIVVGRGYPRVVGPRVVGVAPFRFARPYYAFRPRLSLGFGLWAGFPVIYPYGYGYYYPSDYYGYDYPAYGAAYPATSYPDPASAYPPAPSSAYPATGYPPAAYPAQSGSIGVQPGQPQANTGGVSFDISPSTAQILVDGSYVGTAGEFGPTTQPLGLPVGRHRIEIREQGYQTITFEADIVAGQVIPYQGSMQR